jgi:hypothetical protein
MGSGSEAIAGGGTTGSANGVAKACGAELEAEGAGATLLFDEQPANARRAKAANAYFLVFIRETNI